VTFTNDVYPRSKTGGKREKTVYPKKVVCEGPSIEPTFALKTYTKFSHLLHITSKMTEK
jgi:hypothetical protein